MTPTELEHKLGIRAPSPEQSIAPDWQHADQYQLAVKRDDLLHPAVSGNKWRKLKYALTNYIASDVKELVSFGGGYSNHLHALSYACSILGIRLTAIVRGDYSQQLTPMLQDIKRWGAELQFVDRQTYRQRDEAGFLSRLAQQHPKAVIVPEGGSQQAALQGVAEIIAELQQRYDYILVPVGSGGTLAGLISANSGSVIVGIAVLKGEGYLEGLVRTLLPEGGDNDEWQINHDFHFGGYAKSDLALREFCQRFAQAHNIPIEPVYSGKLFFSIRQLVEQQKFPPGSRILILHTGGLQGNR